MATPSSPNGTNILHMMNPIHYRTPSEAVGGQTGVITAYNHSVQFSVPVFPTANNAWINTQPGYFTLTPDAKVYLHVDVYLRQFGDVTFPSGVNHLFLMVGNTEYQIDRCKVEADDLQHPGDSLKGSINILLNPGQTLWVKLSHQTTANSPLAYTGYICIHQLYTVSGAQGNF